MRRICMFPCPICVKAKIKKKIPPKTATGIAILNDFDRTTYKATPTMKQANAVRVPDKKKPSVQHKALMKNNNLSFFKVVVIAKI